MTAVDDDRFRVCAQRATEVVDLSGVHSADRARAIVTHRSKWVSGTTLRYAFFEAIHPAWDLPADSRWAGSADQEDVVREGFAEWKDQGIGLDFVEVDDPDEAEIRIGFVDGDGSWSYLGRQILDQGNPTTRTMNFGWDLTTPYGRDTARHEIGHTLGMPHEHQNPNAGIVWDEARVITTFAGPPNNWPPDVTRHNVLRKLDENDVFGSDWDRNSIMHYQFPGGLIIEPAELVAGLEPEPGLSTRDIAWIQAWYPPLDDADLAILQPNRSQPVQVLPGAQAHYLIRPDATREYTVSTLGRSDTVLVLFEEIDGAWRFLTGDDDSGSDRNAEIEIKLFAGRRYALRARLYYSDRAAEIAVILY